MTDHRPNRRNGKAGKVAGVLGVACSLVLALLAFTSQEASAHTGKFDHDNAARADVGCPEGDVPNGQSVTLFGNEFIGCTPQGYVLIGGDVPLCEEARGVFVSGICTFDRARECGERPDFLTPIGDGMCVRAALVRAEFAPAPPPRGGNVRVFTVASCINSELAQEEAYSKSIGDTFIDGGLTYRITTGESCNFNCLDGWDINCDGKIGDFCRSEFDLDSVADAASCIEEMKETTDDATETPT